MRGVRGSRPFVIAKSAASRRPREKFRESRRCHQSAQREQSPARLGYDARCEIESAPTSARPPVAVAASGLTASAQAAQREQSPARLGYDARFEIESAPTSARPPVAVPASALLASAQAAEEVK